MKDAVIVAAVRTAVGKAPNGTLRGTRPDELAAAVIAEVLKRAPALSPSEIDDVILGCAMPEGEQGLNVARIASLRAGVPVSASAVTINRFCASGLQAIAFAAERIMGGFASAILAGGAFAAFLSTASGLTISVAGVIDQDFLARTIGRRAGGDVPRIRTFRLAAVVAVVVPYAASWLAVNTSLADTVGLAFAVAASTFCPLLVLGVWWRRLSVAGATAGLVTGGVLALTATTITVLGGPGSVGGGWLGALLAQPAAWTVPTAFLVAVLVSYATPGSVPVGTSRTMVRLHAPEDLRAADPPARTD